MPNRRQPRRRRPALPPTAVATSLLALAGCVQAPWTEPPVEPEAAAAPAPEPPRPREVLVAIDGIGDPGIDGWSEPPPPAAESPRPRPGAVPAGPGTPRFEIAMQRPQEGPEPAGPLPLPVLDEPGPAADVADAAPGPEPGRRGRIPAPAAAAGPAPSPDPAPAPAPVMGEAPEAPEAPEPPEAPEAVQAAAAPEAAEGPEAPAEPEIPKEPPAPTWTIQSGLTLREIVSGWARDAGWKVSFETRNDWPVEASASVQGTFLEAVRFLAEGFRGRSPSPSMTAYLRNHALVVRDDGH